MQRNIAGISAFLLLVLTLASTDLRSEDQPASASSSVQQANADLDVMARELAKLASHPGFRGYIRSEIAKSKNRENIVDLEKFLARASTQRNMPPGLDQLREFSNGARSRVAVSVDQFQGYDLYIPVNAHRAKWKGGSDFVVAYAPIRDDREITGIPAYMVSTGERIILDPSREPETIVLIIAPDEHESHEPDGRNAKDIQPYDGPVEPHAVGKDAPDRPVDQSKGNSFIGAKYMWIRDVHEEWWNGQPEIKGFFSQMLAGSCKTFQWRADGLQNEGFALANTEILRPNFVLTWWLPTTTYCAQSDGTGTDGRTAPMACWYFDQNQPRLNKIRLDIYEEDFAWPTLGWFNRVFELYHNVNCAFRITREDDYIDHLTNYKTNFNFGVDYRQDGGNAYVIWHKIH